MEKLTLETEKIMNERFNKDNVIALATVQDGMTMDTTILMMKILVFFALN